MSHTDNAPGGAIDELNEAYFTDQDITNLAYVVIPGDCDTTYAFPDVYDSMKLVRQAYPEEQFTPNKWGPIAYSSESIDVWIVEKNARTL